jgi:protein SCO1/2
MPFDLKMAVIEAQKGLSRPTVNRILEYCFTYEPEGRKYSLQVTKIVGTLTLFILIIFFLVLVLRKKKTA